MLSANKQRKRVIALELTERKRKILYAIIRNYLETGEPVGSRTISKYTDLNLSSATIRNEMSDLEEMGYHTIRFTNEEVLFDIDNVINQIERYFNE